MKDLIPFLIITGPFCAIMLIYSLRKERRDELRRMAREADRKHKLQTFHQEADRWQAELYQRPNSI